MTSKGKRTRITFIDEDADRESGYLMNRYSDMFALARWRYVEAERYDFRKGSAISLYSDFDNDDDTWHDPLHSADSISPYKDLKLGVDGEAPGDEFFVDIEWEFIKGGLNNFSVQQYLRECADKVSHPNKILTVAVCLDESHQSIAGGLYLPDIVYENALQILVYQRFSDSILKYITASVHGDDIGKNERYKNIKPFGMILTMAMTEHNRWNVEQLLMHYSPVRKEEQQELIRLNISDKKEHKKKKDILKKQMRHIDICSYNRLKDVDDRTIYKL